jgi:hypothetical protein
MPKDKNVVSRAKALSLWRLTAGLKPRPSIHEMADGF